MQKKFKTLVSNKSFCTALWTHLHVVPSGKVLPCCNADASYTWDPVLMNQYANINDSSVQQALNSPRMREIRTAMLAGETVSECSRCYHREDSDISGSMRHWFNTRFASDAVQELVEKHTDADGTLNHTHIEYLDVRFGNICNLKCRMCGHGFSSSWHAEEKYFKELSGETFDQPKFIHVDFYEDLEKYLPHVEEIYFAGGEPMLYPEHFQILERLISLGRTHVHLRYNTNMTTLSYKGKSVVPLWEQFTGGIGVGASIDAHGDTLEFIRTGAQWDKIVANMNQLVNVPQVTVWPATTLGILNVHTLPDFWDYAISAGWDNISYQVNFIQHPEWMNIINAPLWFREQALKIIRDYMITLEDRGLHQHIGGFQDIINYIESSQTTPEQAKKSFDFAFMMLDVYKKSAGLNWETSLPHMVDVKRRHTGES